MTSDTGVVMSSVAEADTADFESDSERVDQKEDITKASSPRARSLRKSPGDSSDSE
jgi:hypothetical protein